MAKEYIHFKESIELFLSRTMSDLMSEKEIPRLNILFPPDAFKLFEYVKEHPFTKEKVWIPPVYEQDIQRVLPENQQDPNALNIIVHNPVKFFEYLTDITNFWLDQKDKYWGFGSGRALFITAIKRLWLRMSPNDANDIEGFLRRQLMFLKSTAFDDFIRHNIEVGEFEGFKIYASKVENQTWCETNDKMTFILQDSNGNLHYLPSIYFATVEENGRETCYIYAIQNERNRITNKKIERKLYKLNSGIKNPNVNPGSLLSLKTFIDMLSSRGITSIKVPLVQILSYRYHEIMSETTKRDFESKWTAEKIAEINSLDEKDRLSKLNEYEHEKNWYNHVVDKQDFISSTKTEGLLRIFYRVSEQFGNLEFLNTPFLEDENLNISIQTPEPKIKIS